jgi:pimeloyl-ACP methyl ester carboxylesterase
MHQTYAPGSGPPLLDWFAHSGPAALRAVALVIHGLNFNPVRMASIIAALNEAGVDAARLSLRGHGLNFERRQGLGENEARLKAFKGVSYRIWFQETLMGYEQARQTARSHRVPLVLIGFSYGGLMGLDLLASREDVRFQGAVLFAPALSLRGWDYAIRLFSPFPRLVIPTLAPAEYLANPGTPMAGYNALFETLDHFESHIGLKLNIPVLVIMDPGDELVSFDGLKRLAAGHHLSRWRYYPVQNHRSLLNGTLRHIIIDEASVGKAVWAGIKTAMITHLLGNSVSPRPD